MLGELGWVHPTMNQEDPFLNISEGGGEFTAKSDQEHPGNSFNSSFNRVS